jgi:tRNA-modifying protein YgfZ
MTYLVASLAPESVQHYRVFVSGLAESTAAFDTITAIGPDTQKFLHSLLSQHIDSIDVGLGAWSFLLQPQGKVVALLHVSRETEDGFVLRSDAGSGAGLLAMLSRYRIRTKTELTLVENVRASVRIEGVVPMLRALSNGESRDVADQDNVVYDTARVMLGWPAFPHEINEATIPNETGVLDFAVNFKKGCYVGQELVERIASRAVATPHRLVQLQLNELPTLPLKSASPSNRNEPWFLELFGDGEKSLGTVTSIASLRDSNEIVALAYVARSVADDATLVVRSVDGDKAGSVEAGSVEAGSVEAGSVSAKVQAIART